MDRFHVQGPTELQDEVTISGVKNAVLPILFAALLAEKPIEIQSVPKLRDVDTSMRLLSQLGAKVERNGFAYINARNVNVFCMPYDLVETIHASIWALGPLVARFDRGQISLPGGCTIGARPVDLHITGLKQLGTTIKLEEDYVKASIDGRLKDAHTVMDKVSVDTTVIIMYAATLTEGTTIIENAAREPEIVGTANFLIALGTKITSQGTNRTTTEGVEHLGDGVYRILPDHIETGTFLVVATISRGKIICRNAQPDALDVVLAKLCDAGADIKVGDDWISLDMHGKRPKAVDIHTAPHPTFPADMQTQFMLLSLVAEGTGFITETVFENRSMHVPELSRVGAHVEVESSTVICHGVETLSGAQVMATDLRASAGLVLARYIAEGTAVVDHICHTDRGHERIEDKLHALGANIERVKGK